MKTFGQAQISNVAETLGIFQRALYVKKAIVFITHESAPLLKFD